MHKSVRIVTSLFGLAFLLAAGALTALYAKQVPPTDTVLVGGTVIAGVPVGGMDETEARARVEAAYDIPLELDYLGSRIQVQPQALGFSLQMDSMLEQVRQSSERSWSDRFWGVLWNDEPPLGTEISGQFSSSEASIREYLEREIAARYDTPPQQPYANSSTGFQPGKPGMVLDIDASIPLIEAALPSRTDRTVILPVIEQPAPELALEQVQDLVIYNINRSDFGGLTAFAMTDLQTGEVINFAIQNGEMVDPEIAFTAASTIKVPILLSIMKRTAEPTPEEVYNLMERMVALSENPPADQLMERYINEVRGPLVVTEDLRALGLENTFLAGYFYNGAPLLDRYTTPANSRSDINLQPDVYNQTTAGEMRDLLTWIYNCANRNSGPILETFGADITQSECQLILDVMSLNKTALLLEAGIPDETRVSHKHGWVEEADGQLRTMSDVGVIYTPGGDYAVSIFLYHPERLNFDAINIIVAQISLAIYNSFNMDDQYPWMAYPKVRE